ncbi:Nif11-like leader peptide family RiPP precursor [Prochlorococcus marinus]|uniref:Uncharacterized protein n=1 Tax=Prochlorococcus marinus (strain MIT 9303) TaxID=59922 RepID=A2C6J3_PROM3|nr:Nif11-like leader peptide family RiPP precursor [Prochlorococcus marinus]ABM77103.1 Hypothetical protein P9303_03511 [Prochlorococcus marinus str. MIT 9303]
MHSIDGLKVDTSSQEQLKADGADQVAIAKAAGLAITSEDSTTDRQNLSDDDLEGVAVAGAILRQPRRAATDPITSSCYIHQSSCSYRVILAS